MTTRTAPRIEPRFSQINYTVEIMPRRATESDMHDIWEMINREHIASQAVNAVSSERVTGWINKGNSFVAVDNATGKVIGHMAVVEWPGCIEVRSVVVAESHREKGIYGSMSHDLFGAIFEANPDAIVVEIKNDNSSGHSALKNAGFIEVPLERVLAMGLRLEDPVERHAFMLTYDAWVSNASVGAALRQ